MVVRCCGLVSFFSLILLPFPFDLAKTRERLAVRLPPKSFMVTSLWHFAALQNEFLQQNKRSLAAMRNSPTPPSPQQETAFRLPKFQRLEIILLLSGMC